jgi:condensin-2 complex subunit H2
MNYSDLAENWNIDIAHELEEYLSDLEKISFSFDGSGKSLNFAEGLLVNDLGLMKSKPLF